MNTSIIPFSEWLKKQLKETGMTQARLAEEADITTSNINRYIKGKAEPQLYTLMRITRAFGLELKAEKRGS